MEQEEFMQQCKQLVSEKSAEDYTMLAQGEAGMQLGACGGTAGGSKPTGARSASDSPPRRQESSEQLVLTQST